MSTPPAAGYVDFTRFGGLRERSHSDAQAALHDVADEFESMFVESMLKASHEADSDDGLFDSSEMKTYREMLDGQLAQSLARSQDFGFEAMLKKQFAGHLDEAAGALHSLSGGLRKLPAGVPVTAPITAAGAAPDGTAVRTADTINAPRARADDDRSAPALAADGGVNKQAFVALLAPHASVAARALGVAPRAIMAQAALESGWGRHVMRLADGRSSYNYFGLKAGPDWRGAVVKVPTTEFVGGRAVTVTATFRAYPDIASAFSDYVAFIGNNPRYQGALAQGANASQYARQLEAAGYATDPHYANKIMAILSGDGWDGARDNSLDLSN